MDWCGLNLSDGGSQELLQLPKKRSKIRKEMELILSKAETIIIRHWPFKIIAMYDFINLLLQPYHPYK